MLGMLSETEVMGCAPQVTLAQSGLLCLTSWDGSSKVELSPAAAGPGVRSVDF